MNSDDVLKWAYETDLNSNLSFDGKIYVLATLNHLGPVKSTLLADSLCVSRARITSILNDLEKCDFIKRDKLESDKRITIIKLTDLGKKFIDNKISEIKEQISLVLNEVGEEKFKIYMEVVETISKKLRSKKS